MYKIEVLRVMRTVLILAIILTSFLACASEAETLAHTYPNEDCSEKAYQHKSKEQLSAMGSDQLVEESVKEQLYHYGGSWNLKDHDDDYAFSFRKHLNVSGAELQLPILIRFLDEYSPRAASKCAETRFFVALGMINDIDNSRVRLRALEENGRRAIEALEKSVQKLKDAGFQEPNHDRNFLFNLSSHNLEMAKATNIRDEMIRATLEARHKIRMSESEYLEFTNFITSLDPRYPTWSEIGEYGPPTLMRDSKRYYEAFNRFKSVQK